MTDLQTRALAATTLGRRLGDLVAEENALLRSRRPAALASSADEKQRLTEAYEIEVQALKAEPAALSALGKEPLARLRDATGYFQDQLEEHRRLVQAAKALTEKMLNQVAERAGRRDKPVMNYGRDAVMAPAFKAAATAVPLTLDQVI